MIAVGCRADFDCNRDLADLAGLLANFGRNDTAVQHEHGDADQDDDIDLADLAVLLSDFGGACGWGSDRGGPVAQWQRQGI